MTCEKEEVTEKEEELMEIEIADASNGGMKEIKENGILLWPVMPQEGGEGLPYAPVDWPNPGDIWGWKVGKRIAVSGYYLDRYLYLPLRFQKSRRKRDGFASKLSVQQYVLSRFPASDVNAFFSSFSWKIPSKQAYLCKDRHGSLRISSVEMAEQSPSDSLLGVAVCKAGNRFCSSLMEEEISSSSASQACDICCSEPGFCRECCCILCCNRVDLGFGGYSFIRCKAIVGDGLICGHAAHINCALRSYNAGTVGGSVGLDTQYYCRRCDSRTDLTKHVASLLNICETVGSGDEIEKILSIGACLLRGSKKKGSQKLLSHIESVLDKLKGGCDPKDVRKFKVDVIPVTTGEQLDHMNYAPGGIDEDNHEQKNEYLELENGVDQVLGNLRKSHEQEFRFIEERLHTQKDYLFCLLKHTEKEKAELGRPRQSTDRDALLNSILKREEHLKHELLKLKDMESIADGLVKAPVNLLKEHFDLDFDK